MKNNICIVTPTLGCGGLERVVSELANYTSQKSYTITVICLVRSDIYYSLDDDVNIVMPSFKYRKGFFNKIKTFLYLIKSINKLKSVIVLGFGEAFNPLTILAARITFNKVFISDRSSPSRIQSFRTNLFRRILYPYSHGMIAQTDAAKKILEKNKYNKNIIVIPNPLREINDLYCKSQSKVIISVGRLVPGKNFSSLINIFNSLENADDWSLVIVGEGPERNNLEMKVKSLNLAQRVTLTGAVRDVDKLFSKASIFAFTSSSEGFPNALSEAMAFPLACISYDCLAGPSDIIKNKSNGVLVPNCDAKTFKKELQKIIDDPELVNFYKKNALLNRNLFNRAYICEKYLYFIR